MNSALLIDGLPLLNVVALCVGTLLVSFLVSAVVGPTGGLQLATVATFVPAYLAIPLHAWITGFSALFRASNLFKQIDWRFFASFVAASIPASIVGIAITAQVDRTVLMLTIGAYIGVSAANRLFRIWQDRGERDPGTRRPILIGMATGFLTVFVGATGPLLVSLIGNSLETKERLMGTYSACLTVQHLSKIVLFGVIGIQIFNFPTVLVLTLACSWLGTFIGTKVLIRVSENQYRIALNLVLLITGISSFRHIITLATPNRFASSTPDSADPALRRRLTW